LNDAAADQIDPDAKRHTDLPLDVAACRFRATALVRTVREQWHTGKPR
jgi:hypothetical protein